MSKNEWLITVDQLVRNGEEDQLGQLEKEICQRPSIYKIPAYVKNANKNAYTPQVVSFGPYHCKNENLKPMEEHKERALIHFLKRTKVTIQECFESFREIMNDLRNAYDSLDANFQKNEDVFLEIMIRDGCFMLEIFHCHYYCWNSQEEQPIHFEGYAENDPIFSKHGELYVMPLIRRDMLLLENQLPMLVLHKLYEICHKNRKLCKLCPMKKNIPDKLAFKFFFPNREIDDKQSNSLHILDMYRKSLLGPKNDSNPAPKCIGDFVCPKGKCQDDETDDIMRPAVELQEAGVHFTKNTTGYINGISFKYGKLSIPMC